MFVKVAEYRNAYDSLYRLANVDYHACVGVREIQYWKERAERVLAEVRELECKRASENDRHQHTQSITQLEAKLKAAQDRVARLQLESHSTGTVH